MSKNGCFEMLCKGCKKNTPESMKSFIDEDVSCEDEVYYCFWCNFIQSTGIDESIMNAYFFCQIFRISLAYFFAVCYNTDILFLRRFTNEIKNYKK